ESESYEAEEYESESYESEEYGIESYGAEEYETEEYESEEYESEEYGIESYGAEEYESEEYEPEMYEMDAYETEEYESGAYDPDGYETEEYESEQYGTEEYEAEEYAAEEYEPEKYAVKEYESAENKTEELYSTKEINIDTYEPDDYAEDTGSYYDDADEEYYEDSEDYYESDEYYDDEYYDEDSFDTSYGAFDDTYENDIAAFGAGTNEDAVDFLQRIKNWVQHMTAFDAILASTGVVVVVAALVILSMLLQKGHMDKQIAAIAPMGKELQNMGVGSDGLLAMSNAALSGEFVDAASTEESSSSEVTDTAESSKVNVSFVSVEKDLKIRFTDANTGELITGTVFEVILTSSKGKKLVLTDDDMDGVIYAQNVNAGVFDAVVTSTDKYKFPTMSQQVTVKDKVEYVVINVQDEVKTEKQVNIAQEDTQKNDAAAEAEVLKDTVEWVESTRTPISGTESYLLVDKNTIADPSQVSKAAARMLFDTLNVSLDKSEAALSVGASVDLKGTEFSDSKDGDIEYQYTTEWKSSNDNVAAVSGGKVTAKGEGTAIITYTVTRKTITTTYEPKNPVEETLEISVEEYERLSDKEKEKCTPIRDDAGQTIGYTYKKVTEPEKKTSETTDTASAECVITVEAVKIASGVLELSKSADSCAVGATLTVKPAKLVYTKQDGSKETITENFPAVIWESADNSIATVDDKGVVTGVKAGKVHISGKIAGIKGADGKELDIRCSVEVAITGTTELTLTLDRTKDVYLAVGGSTTLVPTVTGYQSDAGVTWETSDKKVATVSEKGVVTGVAPGSVTITAVTKEKNAQGNQVKAACIVTINSNASSDTTTKLKDKNGNQIYIKNSDGSYREAVYADYFSNAEFYIIAQPQYRYTGWQTIDGKTYFYDKNGNVVTGTQIIQGVTYNFGADGAIATTANGSTFGIDVSRHNGNIDWNAVKASGVDYVIIRCGYRGSATGVLIEDQTFRTNIKGATAAGLKVGVYVFSQAVNEVEAVKEASLAVSLVKGYNLTYPIFIDTESSGGRADRIDKATRTAVVNAFCQTVASAGYKPGIYASKTWFEDKLNMGAVNGSYKIWLAQYSAAPTYKGKYDLWQYSSKGKISGINTKVDLNYSYLGY
ncbi:MAG: Ig-like domain-containing protein, partial [Lachnospiraceae bacterium]|nr:Ig-like domain-containing protein [Lachnospiraceae bacterium]